MSLFRQEAVTHQSVRLTGAVSLAQPLSIKLTVFILMSVIFAIVTFIFNAEYSRKETVRGFLIPNKGVIKSFASQGGTIEKLWVQEGDRVNKGDPLVNLVLKQNSADGVSLSSKLQKQLKSQLALLDDEISQHEIIRIQERNNLENKEISLQQEKLALESQFNFADEKLELLLAQQAYIERLNNNGFVSRVEKEALIQELLQAKQEKQNILRLLLQQKSQLNQAIFDRENLPRKYALLISNLMRKKAEIQNQLDQVRNNYRYTVTASNAGTITGIQIVEGETLPSSKGQSIPLLHILPVESVLVAEILVPTRSSGFIENGHVSRLRFDAFPYQRFGFIESVITRVDRAIIAPSETSLPIVLKEPVYRLRATLRQQEMLAYGQKFELKSGMLFEADIMLEKRTLIEWLLEPIYSLKGRVS
ncbi:HlyD family efflux transporter periplasmic adaptor subunit [Thalassotalea sp. M1531]|uniref:HlyD family efflux transporter periplasmic adaptor subunit n=1 Tax=Thalassotalea algicola TaxID=2716224 RepID=A0A7Y0LC27_9GAMM|nr:HlyD family efflux transporter periplasmic adaptor subunit [Thalassotalea algicola]NMP31794.1 HlyD family efflux transporter periplasmic adaptor subunit [Thalassotalea algicola]